MTVQTVQRPSNYVARGWCQGYREKNGAVCAEGARTRALGPTQPPGYSDSYYWKVAQRVGTDISGWNDSISQTQAIVYAVLRAVEDEDMPDVPWEPPVPPKTTATAHDCAG